jgi:DNA-binding MarR family transcriptional regulator
MEPQSPRDLDRVVEAIVFLYTESRRITKEAARRFGLTGPQLTVLKLLEGVGDLSLSALSEHIRRRNSTVTGIVDRMVAAGLVVRSRSDLDRRVIHIRLTPEGRRLARETPVRPMAVFQEALASLTRTERADLARVLIKVADVVRRSVESEKETAWPATKSS